MNEHTDPLERLAAIARNEAIPTVPFSPAMAAALKKQRQEARLQTWLLSAASAAAAIILVACLPALLAGPDPLEALFHVATAAIP